MVNGMKYKRKKHYSTAFVITVTLLVSVFLVIVTFLGIYLSGIRYLKKSFNDGSYIKFFGKVDKDGYPISGKLYYSDGNRAEIDIKTSTVTYSNGTVYEGMLVNLQKNGNGKIIYSNGDIYVGTFVNDKLTGHGVYTFSNGDTYEGDFVNGKKHGYGKYTRAQDNSTYEGYFKNGAKHGEGTYTWADGFVLFRYLRK